MSADIEANLSKLESKELIYKINNSLLTCLLYTSDAADE